MPVDAIAVVVVERGVAAKYYSQVPVEPIPAGLVGIKKAVLVQSNLIALLQKVATTRPPNLVVVSHGTGSGISISLAPKSESHLVSPHLETLANSDGKVSAELAKELDISLTDLRALQASAQRVRGLKLGRVDFRACILGEFTDTMELLRTFFGAGAVSAPKQLDEFGFVSPGTPTVNPNAWAEWPQEHPFGKVEGDPPNRVGFETYGKKSAMMIESRAGLRAWLAAKLPGSRYKQGRVFYHGVHSGSELVMPGEVGYRDMLGQVP
ncbi:hypothetical protein [Promicromonospora soli]